MFKKYISCLAVVLLLVISKPTDALRNRLHRKEDFEKSEFKNEKQFSKEKGVPNSKDNSFWTFYDPWKFEFIFENAKEAVKYVRDEWLGEKSSFRPFLSFLIMVLDFLVVIIKLIGAFLMIIFGVVKLVNWLFTYVFN